MTFIKYSDLNALKKKSQAALKTQFFFPFTGLFSITLPSVSLCKNSEVLQKTRTIINFISDWEVEKISKASLCLCDRLRCITMETLLHHNWTRSPGLHQHASVHLTLQRLWNGTKEALLSWLDNRLFWKAVDKCVVFGFCYYLGLSPRQVCCHPSS